MPNHQVRLAGEVADVFFHRFVIAAGGKHYLADIGPTAAGRIELKIGDQVEVEGEQKPSEIKVSKLSIGGRHLDVDWDGPKHGPKRDGGHAPFRLELAAAVKAAEDAGYNVVGDPRRGPRHFELLVSRQDEFSELHIHEDGAIRIMRQVQADDPKWRDAIAAA